MLARDLEVLADQAHRRDAAEADDQLRAQQRRPARADSRCRRPAPRRADRGSAAGGT